jgi:hypothetical protein
VWHDPRRRPLSGEVRVRRWAHNNIQKGSIPLQAFWIFQLIAGMTLSPNINWRIYRYIKKGIAWYENKKYHTHKKIKNIRLNLTLAK